MQSSLNRSANIKIKDKSIKITYCPDVYTPQEDSILLGESMECQGKCLEIGCGTGLLSIYMSLKGFQVYASDINPSAVACTINNALANGVRIECKVSDLFEGISGSFKTIIFNPPYLPGELVESTLEDKDQWYGGEDGFDVINRFLKQLPSHLEKDGRAFIILSSHTDNNRLFKTHRDINFKQLSSKSFFMESIYCFSLAFK
jgi:release factor glutamine methyltransferase